MTKAALAWSRAGCCLLSAVSLSISGCNETRSTRNIECLSNNICVGSDITRVQGWMRASSVELMMKVCTYSLNDPYGNGLRPRIDNVENCPNNSVTYILSDNQYLYSIFSKNGKIVVIQKSPRHVIDL